MCLCKFESARANIRARARIRVSVRAGTRFNVIARARAVRVKQVPLRHRLRSPLIVCVWIDRGCVHRSWVCARVHLRLDNMQGYLHTDISRY